MSHPPFTIEVLGDLRISLNGTPLTGFVSIKSQALFLYVALNPGYHQRSFLVNLLWSEAAESDGKTSLRQVLANLKKIAKGAIDIQRQTVAWQGERPFIDLDQLPQTTDWQTLHPVLRGRFLEGFVVKDAPLFEEWLGRVREQSRLDIITCLDRLSQTANTPQTQLQILTAQLQYDPWREATWLQKIELQALSGREMEALQTAAQLRQLAQSENLPLTPAVPQLESRIRTRQARPHLHNIPPDRTPLIGREEILDQLDTIFTKPENRLVTLFGLGGSGKTRLCQAFGRLAPQRFLEGSAWVPLATVNTLNGMYSMIAQATDQPLSAKYGTEAGLIQWLAHKEMLLVLDNFEQLAPESPAIGRLLDQLPHLRILVSSRQLLNLYDEVIIEVDGLAYPEIVTSQLLDFPAIALFDQSAQRTQPRFRLADVSADVCRICQLVTGLPLAIELAAATLRQRSPAELVQRLQEEIDLLQTNFRNVPERHRSMRAVFVYSWSLLNDAEKSLLAQLSLFVDGFTADAALSVGQSRSRVLQSLIDQAFIQVEQIGPDYRYTLHPLLRQFALEKLADKPDQAENSYDRYGRYFADLVSDLATQLHGHTTEASLTRFDRESGNIRHMWQLAKTRQQIDQIQQIIDQLSLYFYLRGHFQEACDLHHDLYQFLLANPELNKNHFSWYVRSQYALFLIHLSQFTAGAAEAQAIIDHFPHPTQKNAPTMGNAHYALGHALAFTGEAEKGKMILKSGYDWAKKANHKSLAARCLVSLSYIALDSGDIEASQKYSLQALDMLQKMAYHHQEVDCYLSYGNALLQLGEYAQAREQYEKALGLVKTLGLKYTEATALLNMGLVCSEMGDHQSAHAYIVRSAELTREVGDRWGEGNALYNLLEIKFEMGDWGDLEELLNQTRFICEEINDRQGLSYLHLFWSRWLTVLGQYQLATEHEILASSIIEELDEPYSQISHLGTQAALAERTGRFDDAQARAYKMLEMAEDLSDPIGILDALQTLSAVAVQQEAWSQGEALFQQIAEKRRKLHSDRPVWDAEIGRLWCRYQQQKEVQPALTQVTNTVKELATLTYIAEVSRPFTWLIQLLKNTGETAQAEQIITVAHTWLAHQTEAIANPAYRRSFIVESPTYGPTLKVG